MKDKLSLLASIVIPVYNEEASLELLIERIVPITEKIGSCEVLVINDGSTDGTEKLAQRLDGRYSFLKTISLRKKYGQTAALAAGIDASRGEFIVTLDGDLQNPPEEIMKLVEVQREGDWDVVSGWRRNRKDSYFTRVLPSRAGNWLISRITGVKLHDYGCSLKMYRTSLIKEIDLWGELHRFLPALCSWHGATIMEVPVAHSPRQQGKSKYGLSRIFKVVIDLVTVKFFMSATKYPSRLFGGSGLAFLFLGCSGLFYLLIERQFLGRPLGNRPIVLLFVFVTLFGFLLVILGLLGEMLSRIYFRTQDRKIYFMKDEH